MYNRLGASNVNWHDVRAASATWSNSATRGLPLHQPARRGQRRATSTCAPDKRRARWCCACATGDCLTVNFTEPADAGDRQPRSTNVADQVTAGGQQFTVVIDDQVAEPPRRLPRRRACSCVDTIADDGSLRRQQRRAAWSRPAADAHLQALRARRKASSSSTATAPPSAPTPTRATRSTGLFGQVIVEPKGARDLPQPGDRGGDCASADHGDGDGTRATGGQPIIDYEADLPERRSPWIAGGQGGPADPQHDHRGNARSCTTRDQRRSSPARNADGTLPGQHLSAGERGQAQPGLPEPPGAVPRLRLRSATTRRPTPRPIPASTRRWLHRRRSGSADPVFAYLLKGVRDKFMINYGSGGIGTRDHRQPPRRRARCTTA
ncbi:MAG: hypothetical protein MZW92_79895 [Comamonadaceae bacterium]|nr:hypothetical protein [Comamonadaceae bacterium]